MGFLGEVLLRGKPGDLRMRKERLRILNATCNDDSRRLVEEKRIRE